MSRKRGCSCEGHWRARLAHYVVTRRNEATVDGHVRPSQYSEIKCRICRHKWRSKARYAVKLPDYRERTYGKLTDRQILQMIRRRHLRINLITAEVRKERYYRGWLGKWITLLQTPCKRRGYMFVDIKHCGRRKWIAVHRLVWMARYDRLVPRGREVDHKDFDRKNNNIANLRLLPRLENMRRKANGNGHSNGEIPF